MIATSSRKSFGPYQWGFRENHPSQRQRPRLSHRPRRPFELESLEPRLLLDGDTPLLAAQADAIKAGLSNLEGWADTLETIGSFTQQIPVVGTSIAEVLNIGDVLKSKLADPVNALGSTPTPNQIDSALEAILGADSVTTTVTGTEVKFDIVYGFDDTFDTYLDLPGNDSAVSIDGEKASDASFNRVTLNTHLDLHFTFGLDLTGGLAASEAFFVKLTDSGPTTEFSAGIDFSGALPTLQANVGFLDVNLGGVGSVFNLQADLGIKLNDPDNSDGLNHVTLAELLGTSLGSLITLPPTGGATSTLTGTLSATLPVSASLPSGYSAGATVTLSDTNLFDATLPAFGFTGVTNNLDKFKNMTPRDAVVLLQQLGTTLQSASEFLNPVGGIPFLENTISSVTDLTQAFLDFAANFYDVQFSGANSYTASAVPPANFQLQQDAVFQYSFDGVTFTSKTLTAAATSTNGSIGDLVSDLNSGPLSGTGITASDEGGRIKFSAGSNFVLQFEGKNDGMPELGFQATLANAVFKFDSVQTFITLLDDLLPLLNLGEIGVAFDSASNSLTFRVKREDSFDETVEFDFDKGFDVGIGELSVTGHAEADFHVGATVDVTLGVDLSPLGGSFMLTDATTLASLGVQTVAGNDFKVTRIDGSSFFVDVDAAATADIAGLKALISSQSGGNVVLEIVPDDPATSAREDVSLRLRQISGAGAGALTVARENSSLAAPQLKIAGTDTDPTDGVNQIIGLPLHGDTLNKHFFINEGASVTAAASITAPTDSIDLFASLGIVEVGVKDGEGSINVTTSFVLNDPSADPDNGRVTFEELLNSPLRATLEATADAVGNGRLLADATLAIEFNGLGGSPVSVTVLSADTATNATINDLIADFQNALNNTALPGAAPYNVAPFAGKKLGDFVTVGRNDDKLTLTGTLGDVTKIRLDIAAGNPAITELHFTDEQTSAETIVQSLTLTASGSIHLPLVFSGLEFLQSLGLPTNPSIDLAFSAGSPVHFTPTVNNLPSTDDLAKLADFSSVDFFAILKQILVALNDPNLDLLNKELPLINQSVNDLLSFTEPIQSALDFFFDKIKELKTLLLEKIDGPLVDSADGTSQVPDAAINSIREYFTQTSLVQALDTAHPGQNIISRVEDAFDAVEDAIRSLPDSITDPDVFDLPGKITAAIGAFKDLLAAVTQLTLLGSKDAPADGKFTSPADFSLEFVLGSPISIVVPVADATALGFTNGQSAATNLTATNAVPGGVFAPGKDVTFTLTIGSTTYLLTVPKSATDGNADIAALVADINGVRASAKKLADGTTFDISGLVEAQDAGGGKLRFHAAVAGTSLALGGIGATGDNASLADLVADIQSVLNNTPFPNSAPYNVVPFKGLKIGDLVTVGLDGAKITFNGDFSQFKISIGDPDDPMIAQLGFGAAQAVAQVVGGDLTNLNNIKQAINDMKRLVPGVQQLQDLLFDTLGLRNLITDARLATLKADVLNKIQEGIDKLAAAADSASDLNNAARHDFQLVHNRLKTLIDPIASVADLAKLDLIGLLNIFNDFKEVLTNPDYASLLADSADPTVTDDAIDFLNEAVAKFSASFPGRLHFDFDTAEKRVTFGLDFDLSDTETVPLDFDLQDVPGVTGVVPVELKTGGTFDVTVGAKLTLDFGVDLDAAPADFFFLLPTTQFALTGLINTGTPLTAELTIGGIGAKLKNGDIRLQKDITDTATDDPASLTLALSDTAGDTDGDGLVDLGELAGWFDLSVDGAFKLEATVEILGVDLAPNLKIEIPLDDLFDPSLWTFTVPTIDFSLAKLDLMGIIKAIETFLGFLSSTLDSELLKKLPLVGDDLSSASSAINDFKDLIESIRTTIEANISDTSVSGAVTEALQKLLFDTLGPGLPGSDATVFNLSVTPLDVLKIDPAHHDSDADGDADNVGTPDTVLDYRDVDVLVTVDEDGNNDTPGDSDDENIVTDPDASVAINLHFAKHEEFDTTFNLGFNALNLVGASTNGGIKLGLDFDVELGLKLDKQHGVSLLLNNDVPGSEPDLDGAPDFGGDVDPEIEAGVSVVFTDGSSLQLDLFFLRITATNHDLVDPADPDTALTGFSGVAAIDLQYSSAEVPILNILDLDFDASFAADVEVDLRLDATVAGNKNLPSLRADLLLDWHFDLDTGITPPHLQILNFGLDLGGFISKNISPILKKINEFLDPIRPVLDFLELEVPIISQLSQLIGQGTFTFLDGISLLGEGGDTVARVIGILVEIDNFVQTAASVPGDIFIEFGDFDFGSLSDPDTEGSIDPNTVASPFADITAAFSALNFTGADGSPADGTTAKNFVTNTNKDDEEGGLNVQFPILTNPANALKLLFGQDADLITMDIPRLEASFEFSQIFGPIIPPFPVFAKIGGKFGVFLDLFVGMDTRGIRTGNFLNGFYFGDFANGSTGDEVPEAGVFMELTAGAELNIAFAKAGVEGGIRAEITADWHDEASPGKVYLDEILANLQRGIECIFDLHGELSAFLGAYLNIVIPLGFTDITIIDVSFTIIEITLLEFNHSCPPLPPPEPASLDGTTLKLNIGDRAGQRQTGATDGDEVVTIFGEFDRDGDGTLSQTVDKNADGKITEEELGEDLDNSGTIDNGVVAVVGFGQTRLFGRSAGATLPNSFFKSTTLITKIEGNAGEGDDSITLDHVRVPAALTGGNGDDEILVDETIQGTPAVLPNGPNDTIEGGDGDDQITGGRGNDVLRGDAGNDTIFGNAGGDLTEGGTGDDVVYGGSNDNDEGKKTADTGDDDGNDTMRGQSGDDKLYGHSGNDSVDGGPGADFLGGSIGNDTMRGGPDNDTILGEDGNDNIEGAAGDDQLKGGKGNDIIKGQDGKDYIEGGEENDTIEGGAGEDKIIGGRSDAAAADPDGNDLIDGGTENDIIIGDNGLIDAVTLIGGAGNDTIFGSTGSDLIYGQGGNDIVFADDATPFLPNQSAYESSNTPSGGNDTVFGNDGSDILVGGTGSDKIFGGDDTSVDILLGDNGKIVFTGSVVTLVESTAFSDGANDTLQGGAGDDVEVGGRGADSILGSEGDDILVGDHGQIKRHADGTLELILAIGTSEGGNDTIQGNDGNDTIMGGTGADSITGNNGADVIHGDNARLDYNAAGVLIKITTIAPTDSGDDTITGFIGDDTIVGGTGDDNISGFSGNDVLLGDNGDITLVNEVVSLIESTFPDNGGRDTITGGLGNDTIVGGSGNGDISSGAAGDGDSLFGNEGDDLVLGDNAVIARDPVSNRVKWIKSIFPDKGGDDTIQGNAGLDILLGGYGADDIQGNENDDIILGDNGSLFFVDDPGTPEVEGDGDITRLDLIRSFTDGLGGADTITGNAGADVAMGGMAGDLIYGDDAAAGAGAGDLRDILLGDNGDITLLDLAAYPGTGLDAITIFGGTVKTLRTTDTLATTGGRDTVTGNALGDIILGGVQGDALYGDAALPGALDGDDIMLGDNGRLEWLYGGDVNFAAIEAGFVFDNTLTTLDLVTTELPIAHPGGRDVMYGHQGKDVMFGGEDADTLYGDDGDLEAVTTNGDRDVMFGDHGRLYPQFSFLRLPGQDWHDAFPSRNFFSIDTGNLDNGEGDRIWGEEGADIQIGGQGDDRMFGGSGDDDMIGGHNVAGGFDELTPAAIIATLNPSVNDLMDGGTGNDAMAGDNAIMWRRADSVSPRFHTLTLGAIYTTTEDSITTNVDGTNRNDPDGTVGRDITILDHAFGTAAGLSGADVMAGGAGRDTMFGELGNDLMQGDGFIGANDNNAATVTRQIVFVDSGEIPPDPDTGETLYFNVPEAATDSDDYIEGNGGDDLIYGGLGQDDIIGGSSGLFGLTTADQRPDGSDTIFGGAGVRISRSDVGDPASNGHSRDSDFILGDNGNVFRLVTVNGTTAYKQFAYDNYAGTKIRVRAVQQLDYTLGGADFAGGSYNGNGAANADNGAADLIYGEDGDDFIFGMAGSDVIFGNAQDDDIIGGYGHDWASGGTGQDGVLGDDGLLLTSRNGTAEPLYNIAATTQQTISTPGSIQLATINVTGELKKTVDVTPLSFDSDWIATDDEFPDNSDESPFADDIIFGGLGSDFLHGGSGDDAISGAEALGHAYVPVYDVNGNPTGVLDLGYLAVGLGNLNPGDVLAFNPVDTDGQQSNNRFRAGEFALYDEYDPLRKVLLTGIGELSKDGTGLEFLLNFDKTEGPQRPGGTTGGPHGVPYGPVNDDGADAIFGDLGNDWMVGGTGRDNSYGGWGNDLLNADDNQDTNGTLNDQPDTHPTYEDRAYGGAGRDVLIANTGGDRLIDWVGEYNTYLVPFAPFGEATVSRTLQPQLPEFLYALSKADGADPTRPADTGADPLRNGEPDAELGLVLQKDIAWQDQTGPPSDPQAGNIPGGPRDVLRSADFNNGQSQGFAVDVGSWTVTNGRYQVAPTVAGGDAVSVYNVDAYLPRYFEMIATINAVKPTGGTNANAYLIFDYQSPTSFKFAGINVSTNKLEIGHRNAQGWIVDRQAAYPGTIKSGTDYNLFLSVNGTAVTFIVNNQVTMNYTFAPRVDVYGLPHGINEGMTGLGARNSKAQIDNVVVQRIPPVTTLNQTIDFSSGPTSLFQTPLAGTWNAASGRFNGTAGTGAPAIDLFALKVGANSLIDLASTLRTTSEGGFIFDQYAVDDFKFVTISAATKQIILGHRTAKGWFIDAVYNNASLAVGVDYNLGLTLKGTTASVTLNGATVLSRVYNAVVTDGGFGLFSRSGQTSFDSVTVKSDDGKFLS